MVERWEKRRERERERERESVCVCVCVKRGTRGRGESAQVEAVCLQRADVLLLVNLRQRAALGALCNHRHAVVVLALDALRLAAPLL